MNMLPIITQIAGIFTLVALIWLTVRAFKKKPAWGFAVMLLSPVSAAFFGIRYWGDEKKAFLTYITTFVTTATLALYLFTTWGGWELIRTTYHVNKGIQSQMLTARDAENFMKASLSFTEKSGLGIQNTARMEQVNKKLASEAAAKAAREQAAAESAKDDNLEIDAISKKVTVTEERYRLVYLPIKVADAKNHVGSTVKVTRKNVLEKEYRLIGASGRRLELTQHAGRGSYSFHYNIRDIEKIRVLTKQQY
jgi:excinuclease UvrABC nuclease subunit